MSKTKKTVIAPVQKAETTNTKTDWKTKAGDAATVAIDWALKALAAVFLVATSLMTVREWIEANKVNPDFALAGAILVVSVALYLIVRKR